MKPIIKINNVSKVYAGGHQALKSINLDIMEGEILALLGSNGAGKTSLISLICGIISPSSGSVTVFGHDIIEDYRKSRSLIGLVPQEISLGMFDTVWDSVCFSRGLFGKKSDPKFIEQLLRDLSLWDKKDNEILKLSGGMKRRVLIAKALSHEPKILFLDEPTAGVDVELRKDMWALVDKLRKSGVTIILTTHYIEEAEAMADRVGVILDGEILLVKDTATLMKTMGKKQLIIELRDCIETIPENLTNYNLFLEASGKHLLYTYDTNHNSTGITSLLQDISKSQLFLKDLEVKQSSLEDVFVNLVNERTES